MLVIIFSSFIGSWYLVGHFDCSKRLAIPTFNEPAITIPTPGTSARDACDLGQHLSDKQREKELNLSIQPALDYEPLIQPYLAASSVYHSSSSSSALDYEDV